MTKKILIFTIMCILVLTINILASAEENQVPNRESYLEKLTDKDLIEVFAQRSQYQRTFEGISNIALGLGIMALGENMPVEPEETRYMLYVIGGGYLILGCANTFFPSVEERERNKLIYITDPNEMQLQARKSMDYINKIKHRNRICEGLSKTSLGVYYIFKGYFIEGTTLSALGIYKLFQPSYIETVYKKRRALETAIEKIE